MALGLLVLVIAASQLFLPGYAEGRIEDRIDKSGGESIVSVSAFPAARLLARDGDSLEVRGSGQQFALTRDRADIWSDLDGFDEVDVRMADFSAGPIEVTEMMLERPGSEDTYRFVLDAESSADDLLDYATGGFSGSIGTLAQTLTGAALDRRVPIALDLEVESEDGQPRILSGDASVDGFPASLFLEAVAGGFTARL